MICCRGLPWTLSAQWKGGQVGLGIAYSAAKGGLGAISIWVMILGDIGLYRMYHLLQLSVQNDSYDVEKVLMSSSFPWGQNCIICDAYGGY